MMGLDVVDVFEVLAGIETDMERHSRGVVPKEGDPGDDEKQQCRALEFVARKAARDPTAAGEKRGRNHDQQEQARPNPAERSANVFRTEYFVARSGKAR